MSESELLERMHQALKDAWKYVNKPWTSDYAKNRIRPFSAEGSKPTTYRDMIFALQTAWTFVHGSGDDVLQGEYAILLRHE